MQTEIFCDKFGPEALGLLRDVPDKYTEDSATQFPFPDALKMPPVSDRGSISEVAAYIGGPDQARTAIINFKQIFMWRNSTTE